MDVLYKLFVEDQVVLFKTNPVNAYLGPLIDEAFRVLIDLGFLRVVYGGADEGSYLCNLDGVDEIHITGSDKTFDAIVFGTGAEGTRCKSQGQPLLSKRITGELGNVSPVIVIPGPWKHSDLVYQAEHIDRMLTNNAGFNCNATIIVHPATLRDPVNAAAVERAIANLRYGTVGVNYWAGGGFTFGTTTWGAFPGHELHSIKSGTGVVHNTLMFSRPQKSVLWGPFRSMLTPPWFVTQGNTASKLFPKLVAFEAAPSPLKVPSIMATALGG